MIQLLSQDIFSLVQRYPKKMEPVDLTGLLISESIAAGVDPLLTVAIVETESSFNPKATSRVGARGLMQIMPKTKTYIEKLEKISLRDRKSLFEPRYNVRLGIAYLKYLLKKYNGNLAHALMAYNWGPGHVSRAIKRGTTAQIPLSVQRYALKVIERKSRSQSKITSQILYTG